MEKIDQLLSDYCLQAKQHRRFTWEGDARRTNAAYDQIIRIYNKLKILGPDAQAALLKLAQTDDDPGVRCWAASHSLNFNPGAAVTVLKAVARQKDAGIVAFDADMVLKEWKKGRLRGKHPRARRSTLFGILEFILVTYISMVLTLLYSGSLGGIHTWNNPDTYVLPLLTALFIAFGIFTVFMYWWITPIIYAVMIGGLLLAAKFGQDGQPWGRSIRYIGWSIFGASAIFLTLNLMGI